MEKFILKSRTYWGLLLLVAPTLAPALGINYAALQLQELGAVATSVIEVVGAGLVIWGRWKAGGLKLKP